MAKGAAIKFKSYGETVPKLLQLMNIQSEIKKHDSIVLKVSLQTPDSPNTTKDFVESVLSFCVANKDPSASVFIAEGSDGFDTQDLFEENGFRELSEKYSVGLIDLNNSDVEEVINSDFMKFESVFYPKILRDSFVISLSTLSDHSETVLAGSLSSMIGAYPSKYYKGFFSSNKNKIRKFPIKYAIHDIIKCKMPEFSVIDSSSKGSIIAGLPVDMDKESAKLLGLEWKSIPYLKLISESYKAPNEVRPEDLI